MLPLAAAASGLGLALGTIAGGTLNAFLLSGLVLWLAPSLINAGLARAGVRLDSPLDWLRTRAFVGSVQRIAEIFRASSDTPWCAAPSRWR